MAKNKNKTAGNKNKTFDLQAVDKAKTPLTKDENNQKEVVLSLFSKLKYKLKTFLVFSTHTPKEIILHFLRYLSRILLFITVVSTFLGVIIIIINHIWFNSFYSEKIPVNTQKFIHFNLEKTPTKLIAKTLKLINTNLTSEDISTAKNLKINYLTILEHDDQNSSFFIEKISLKKSKEFLKLFTVPQTEINFSKEKINNISVKSIALDEGRPISCIYKTFSLYCSSQKNALLTFIQPQINPLPDIESNLQNVTKNSVITWFATGKVLSSPILQAHRQIIKQLYGSLEVKSNNLIESKIYAITDQNFSSISPEIYQNNYLSLNFPIDKTLFFIAGQNFKQQWLNTEKFYTKNTPDYALLSKGILQQKISQIFGNKIDFYQDILPIFKDQYAFGITTDTNNQLQLNFMANNAKQVEIEKLLTAFFTSRGQFTIEKQELKIDDITLESLKSNEDKIQVVQERIGSSTILGYTIKDKPWGIYVATQGTRAIISTSLESLKLLLNPAEQTLASTFPNKLSGAYEFGFISLTNMENIKTLSPFNIPPIDFLTEIKSVAWESKSFPGGISVVSNLEFY